MRGGMLFLPLDPSDMSERSTFLERIKNPSSRTAEYSGAANARRRGPGRHSADTGARANEGIGRRRGLL